MKTERSNETQRTSQLPSFNDFKSLGKSFDLSPDGLREALQDKGHTSDLTKVNALLKNVYRKVAAGLEAGEVLAADAREYVEVYRDFVKQISSDTSDKAFKVRKTATDLASAIENKLELAISPVERLKNLREYLPGMDSLLYEFASYLADQVHDDLLPIGLNHQIEFVLYELQQGIDGVGRPIQNALVGEHRVTYSLLSASMPLVVRAVYPKKFAEGFEQARANVYAYIEKELAQQRAANPPTPITLDLKTYLGQVQRVSEHIVEVVNRHMPAGSEELECCQESLNASHGQIEPNGGIAIEMYGSKPGDIFTPLGKLRIFGYGGTTVPEPGAMEELVETLGLVNIATGDSWSGTIYAVTKDLDGNQLPTAALRDKVSYMDRAEANSQWDDNLPAGRDDSQALNRRFAADREILDSRGASEPELNDGDIRDLEGFQNLGEPYIKFTRDQGKTWEYARVNDYSHVHFQEGIGINIFPEVMPNAGADVRLGLLESHFENGLVVRPATAEEVEGLKFSYDYSSA